MKQEKLFNTSWASSVSSSPLRVCTVSVITPTAVLSGQSMAGAVLSPL